MGEHLFVGEARGLQARGNIPGTSNLLIITLLFVIEGKLTAPARA
jgi:hypothetical protein